MDMSFLKDWVIPIGSVVLAIWFSASAKKDADRAERLLSQINEAIQGWQRQIMNSATNILDSLPQVIEGKTTLAKMQAAEMMIQTIKEHAANPTGSTHTHEQTMLALSAQLSMLLESTKQQKQ
jgi:hypothetical protein